MQIHRLRARSFSVEPSPAAAPSPAAMVWAARPDMSCEYLSREWLRFTGLEESQALGDGWARAVHPEDLARWLHACLRAFDAREAFEIDYRLRRHDGKFCWMRERAVPRTSATGGFLGFTAKVSPCSAPLSIGDDMNWDRIEGNWKQLKGGIKERWGKITDDELDQLAGKRDKLVGKLQERYGIQKDEAEKQVKEWEDRQ